MPFAKYAQHYQNLQVILISLGYCYLNADLLIGIHRLVEDLAFVEKVQYFMYYQFVQVMLDELYLVYS